VLRVPSRRLLALAALLPLPAAVRGATAHLEASARSTGQELGAASSLVVQALGQPSAASPADEDVQSALAPAAPEEGVESEAEGAREAARSPAHGARRRKPVGSVLVSQAKVLELARASAVPSGHVVERSGARPPGIQLSGVSALGIGLADGDVLTEVAGSPVRSEGRVVGIVVGALARHDARISATFWRGQAPWALVVELPRVTLPADLTPK
jgi:hypothetical protein